MATATLTFDNPDKYGPTDVITVTLGTDAPMTETLNVTGHVEAADGTELDATSTTTVHGKYALDPVTGYTVEQSPDNPAVFVLTPES